jgi:ABC-type multidrug transport system ATPase subunit
MNPLAIQISRLNRRFGALHAVRDLDLEVPQRSVYGFLGPNGAGKTTTIRLLLGLLRADSGEIRIFGSPFESNRLSLLRRIGSMIESPSLYPHLTARENLETKRRMVQAPKSEIDRVLGVVELMDSANRLVRQFSLGMTQRLAIAQAMLGNPELLILDEPTNGLDPAGVADMRRLIRELPTREGLTVFLSSHLLSEVEEIATHIAILSRGSRLFAGTVEDLHAQQRRSLVVRVNQPDAALRLLASSGLQVTKTGPELVIADATDDLAPAVTRMLVQAGFDVSHVALEHPSLEDIFLEMTIEAK